MVTVTVPPYTDMLSPTFQAIIGLGGSASITELDAAAIDREEFSADQQNVLHGDGHKTEIQYRLAWARTDLKGMGVTASGGLGGERGGAGGEVGRHRPAPSTIRHDQQAEEREEVGG